MTVHRRVVFCVARGAASDKSATSPLEISAFGLWRGENREDREHRVDHHQKPDIDIGLVNAIGVQEQPGENWDQPAAVDLRYLIGRVRARGAIAGREILRIEGRDRPVAEAEHEAESNDLSDRREMKLPVLIR